MDKNHVKDVALRMAEDIGLVNISQVGLSKEAGISPGSFAHVVGCKFSEFIEGLVDDVPITQVTRSKRRRAVPGPRKQQLIHAGLALAEVRGYENVTRAEIARAANVTPRLVSYHLGGIDEVRQTIVAEAVRLECLPVIAQAVSRQSPLMDEVDERLKRRALKSIKL